MGWGAGQGSGLKTESRVMEGGGLEEGGLSVFIQLHAGEVGWLV